MAGTPLEIQKCLDEGVFEKVVHLLCNDNSDVKKEAIWALSNALSFSTESQICTLVYEKQCLRGLIAVLEAAPDSKSLIVAMEGLENVLKHGKTHENAFGLEFEKLGGLDILESLQQHKNAEVYAKALKLIEDYFQPEIMDVEQ